MTYISTPNGIFLVNGCSYSKRTKESDSRVETCAELKFVTKIVFIQWRRSWGDEIRNNRWIYAAGQLVSELKTCVTAFANHYIKQFQRQTKSYQNIFQHPVSLKWMIPGYCLLECFSYFYKSNQFVKFVGFITCTSWVEDNLLGHNQGF